METLRTIEHGNGHTDIEALIYGEWVVVKCILEDTMPKVPTELADARIAANIAWNKYDAIDSASPFKQQAWNVVNWLEERSSKMYAAWQKVGGTSDIDSIVAAEIANDNQWTGSVFDTLDTIGAFQDGRNEVENEQIIAYFGRSNVTTSAEWRKRHLHQTAEQVNEAKVNADALKGLRL